MLRHATCLLVTVLMLVGFRPQARAFSLLGPSPASGQANAGVSWQTQTLGYDSVNTDIGGPMNIGEEYRWNVPVLTYAFDQTFADYFGPEGITAVSNAFSILNALTNVSAMSTNLAEYSTDIRRIHYQAQAVGVWDVKSSALSVILEELGLAEPERYTWTLRRRTILNDTAGLPHTNYDVIQRNFDPTTLQPSAYVNDVLYTYNIYEYTAPIVFADAVEQNADLSAYYSTTVASGPAGGWNGNGDASGIYYVGLSRDDVGGLRYLLNPTNQNTETLLADTSVAVTNLAAQTVLTTFSLAQFLTDTAATTNTPAQVLAKYPGVALTSTNAYLTNTLVTNITTFYSNYPASPVPVYVTNVTSVAVTNFNYSYGNLATNVLYSNNTVIFRTIDIEPSSTYTPGLGGYTTNTSDTVVSSNYLNGQAYIKPINLLDYMILSTQSVTVTTNTQVLPSTYGNLFAYTNTTIPVALTTADLYTLHSLTYGTTLTPAQIQVLFPNILITSTNYRLTNVWVTNVVGTNLVASSSIQLVSDYDFGNVVTNFSGPAKFTVQKVDIEPASPVPPGGPYYVTNVLSSSNYVDATQVEGQYYIVPTNLFGYQFVQPLLTNVSSNFTTLNTNIGALVTNTSTTNLIQTMDLATFTSMASVTPPLLFSNAFATNFPGRTQPLITSTSSYFTNVVTGLITAYLTNSPYGTPFDPPTLVFVTNYVTNVVTRYSYTFGNVVTNPPPNGLTNYPVDTITITYARNPLDPATSTNYYPVTNVTHTIVNYPNGQIYTVPLGQVGYSIVATNAITVVPTTFTNLSVSVTITNGTVAIARYTNYLETTTYATNYYLSVQSIVQNGGIVTFNTGVQQQQVRFATNVTYWVYPIQFQTTSGSSFVGVQNQLLTLNTNSTFIVAPINYQAGNTLTNLRRGVDHLQFQQVYFDSLLGQAFVPVTNYFTNGMIMVTNSTNVAQFVRRISTSPDFTFAAQDLGFHVGFTDGTSGSPVPFSRTTTANWWNSAILSQPQIAAGPGVIRPSVTITLNNVGPVLRNTGPNNLNQSTAVKYFVWGSFDGSTNAITLYPSGTSLESLQQQLTNSP